MSWLRLSLTASTVSPATTAANRRGPRLPTDGSVFRGWLVLRSGPLRGGKYSAFEAGTRVPFLVRWPQQVKRGVSDALICQVDFLSSFAAFLKQPLTANDAPDSFDVMNALLGKSKTGRAALVEQAGTLSLRQGQWKYIEPSKGQKYNKLTDTETGNDPEPQLYDLSKDLGERQNVAGQFPDRVKAMAAELQRIRQSGKSRP